MHKKSQLLTEKFHFDPLEEKINPQQRQKLFNNDER